MNKNKLIHIIISLGMSVILLVSSGLYLQSLKPPMEFAYSNKDKLLRRAEKLGKIKNFLNSAHIREYPNTTNRKKVLDQFMGRYYTDITDDLKKYENTIVVLEKPVTQKDIEEELNFRKESEISSVFKTDNWELLAYEKQVKFNPKPLPIDSLDLISAYGYDDNTAKVMPRRSENEAFDSLSEVVNPFSSLDLFIKVDNMYEILTVNHLYQITGFETDEEKIDFVFLFFKLFGSNVGKHSEREFQAVSPHAVPLLFEDYFEFNGLYSITGVYEEKYDFTANLEYYSDQHSIVIVVHDSIAIPESPLSILEITFVDDVFSFNTLFTMECTRGFLCSDSGEFLI